MEHYPFQVFLRDLHLDLHLDLRYQMERGVELLAPGRQSLELVTLRKDDP
jgi:hypothetical protein